MNAIPQNQAKLSKPATLVDMLRGAALELPDEICYIYLLDGEAEEQRMTFGELDRQARAIGAWLQEHKAAGERALLLYPSGLEYIAAYFGCLYAGVIAVPAYPPRINRPVPRIQGIVADAQAKYALTTSDIYENMERRFEHAPDLHQLTWFNTQHLPEKIEAEWKEPQINSQSLAFLQYTSGSTSQPKGVMVSHANLLYNLEQIRVGFHISNLLANCETAVSWLPSYHDMGLIGGHLEVIYVRARTVLISPLAFLQRPIRWLQAISRYRATISGGPNFAYEVCVEKIKPEQLQTLDLSSWRLAFSGAEPVRPDTLARFTQTFAACGFDPGAYYPCYGLAEATLFVSGEDGPKNLSTIFVRRAALESGYVEIVPPGSPDSMELVSCGHSILEQQIIIAHPEQLTRCPDGVVGEVWISGLNIAQGYWNRPEDSQRTFQAYLVDTEEGPYLRTGDLGFIRDNQLYITGRLKDLIIIRGSNHYPQDLELTVEKSHPACQVGGGAAFTITRDNQDELVIVQEITRQARHNQLDEVFLAIRSAISENHDLQAYAIALIRPMTIPKTSSGKIQRHAAKAAFLHGELEIIDQWSVQPLV